MASSRASSADASPSPAPSGAGARDGKPDAAAAAAGGPSPGRSEGSKTGGSEAGGDGAVAEAGERVTNGDGPPLPGEPVPDGPPLPDEPVPQTDDDGWECQWEPSTQAWFFYNRFTGVSQWDNPRVPHAAAAAAATAAGPSAAAPPPNERPAAGGYNPAIHGDYDPNAWYAQAYDRDQEQQEAAAAAAASAAFADPAAAYAASAGFNRFTGQFQAPAAGPGRHSDEAKARRQMNAFFDVDAAANAHDGRSLKAERQNQKLSKSELKAYKEKRRARKEEKRRAWLMD